MSIPTSEAKGVTASAVYSAPRRASAAQPESRLRMRHYNVFLLPTMDAAQFPTKSLFCTPEGRVAARRLWRVAELSWQKSAHKSGADTKAWNRVPEAAGFAEQLEDLGIRVPAHRPHVKPNLSARPERSVLPGKYRSKPAHRLHRLLRLLLKLKQNKPRRGRAAARDLPILEPFQYGAHRSSKTRAEQTA